MSVTYRILPEHGLVLVRYRGRAMISETMETMARCVAEPDFDPAFRHLFDLSEVTGFENDYVGVLALQARAADFYLAPGVSPLIVFVVPHPTAQAMAQLVLRSWEGVDTVSVSMVRSAQEAQEVLGLSPAAMAELAFAAS